MLGRGLVLGFAAFVAWPAAPQSPAARRVVIGYVFTPNAVVDPTAIAAQKLTHFNYAFANLQDGRVVDGFANTAENLARLTALRRSHPHLKVLVAAGGWTWSGGFSDAASTGSSRATFVESAVDFVRRYDLDGFDVDWEYPGLRGNGNVHRPEDKENFTALMAALRAALDKEGAARGRRYLLTFAAGAFPAFVEHTELAKVQASVDFVNLMTYDFRVAAVDPVAGHHANLFDHPSDEKRRSVDGAVRDFLAAGVPASKLVLGVPFYGRGWGEVTPEANGLYQRGKPLAERLEMGHGRLSADIIGRNGFVRFWDPKAQAPYLWNSDRRIFITYEDPESLKLKTRYIRDRGLAGRCSGNTARTPRRTPRCPAHRTVLPLWRLKQDSASPGPRPKPVKQPKLWATAGRSVGVQRAEAAAICFRNFSAGPQSPGRRTNWPRC